jgi:hypothetical protein
MTDPRHEDAVARALDLLPEHDPARTDPVFIRNVALVREAAAARETAVDVWLTVSPLTAAPAGMLERIMEKLPQPLSEAEAAVPVSVRGSSLARTLLAAGGWAAAIVMACLWYGYDRAAEKQDSAGKGNDREDAIDGDPVSSRWMPGDASRRPAGRPAPTAGADRRLQEILRLRAALEREEGREKAPRIKILSPPGSMADRGVETRGELRRMLVNALRSTLEAETGAPGDDAVLVIERGWPSGDLIHLEDGATIRHRNFPEALWLDLGLLRADDGSYLDPVGNLIWSPDSEGRGFIGRRTVEGEDLGRYQRIAPEGNTPAEPASPAPQSNPFVQVEPGGFLIENPVDASVDVVIEGVLPPAEGEQHWFVWTLPDGSVHEEPVLREMFTPSGTLVGNFGGDPIYTGGFSQGGPQKLMPRGLVSLELQVRSSNGTVTGTLLQAGGKP